MVYAYDNWVQLPTKDLYDTQVMAMAINAARDMYEKGQQEMKDFLKLYGDFMTPITADQDWYDLNVTGKVRDTINALYAQGIDPLRNALGRAMISLVINSMPYGDIAKLRMSAANAQEYLKARLKLEVEGKYNPNTELYTGLGLDLFSTLNNGIWDRMSPVPYQNMADFSKAYFDNISPMHRQATKNGITYTVSEITEPMLQDIADRHFNDLVNTPQGRLMYQMYKDRLGSDEAARYAFNNAVVSGNLDRRKYEDDYDKMNLENQKLAINRDMLALQKERLNIAKDKAKKEAGDKAKGWTYRQMVNIMKNGKKALDLSSVDGSKGIKSGDKIALAQNYSAYLTKLVSGSPDMIAARALLSGQTALDTMQDTDDAKNAKRRSISFSAGSNVNFTLHRQYIYGGKKITNGSVTNSLRRYMANHGVSGYIVNDDDISVNMMDYSGDAHMWDINGYARVKYSDISKFNNVDKALELIGATKKSIKVRSGSKQGKYDYTTETYVDIPISRTIDSRGFSDSLINEMADGLAFTKSTTAKRQVAYEEDDMDDIMD